MFIVNFRYEVCVFVKPLFSEFGRQFCFVPILCWCDPGLICHFLHSFNTRSKPRQLGSDTAFFGDNLVHAIGHKRAATAGVCVEKLATKERNQLFLARVNSKLKLVQI